MRFTMRLSIATAVVAMAVTPAVAQTTASKAPAKAVNPYSPPKTPWGDPNIAGSYNNTQESGTPFERPAEFAGKRLADITPEELAKATELRNRRKVERAPLLGGETGTGAGPTHWFEDYNAKNSRP